MPWYWTDHLAALINSQRPTTISQTADWIRRPIGIRVEPDANPLAVAEQLMADAETADDPPLVAA